MRLDPLVPSLTLLLALSAASPAGAAVTRLDFEDVPARTAVTTQWGKVGLLLPFGGYVDTDPAAPSGTRVLRSANPGDEFNTDPLVLAFASGQSRVSFLAGIKSRPLLPLSGTLVAFDALGTRLAEDGPKPVPAGSFTTRFEVRSATAAIVRVELKIGIAEFESIDDLEFEGAAPPPLPTAAPEVRIGTPSEGSDLAGATTLSLSGSVKGDGVVPTARLRWEVALPPDVAARVPPYESALPLVRSGSEYRFELPGLGLVPIGAQSLRVEVENVAGLKGSATVHFVSWPPGLRERDPERTLGPFRWSADTASCRIAVYERGAIALTGGRTLLIRGGIFTKWLAERDPYAGVTGSLGCPRGEDRAVAPQGRAQDFEGGRIYAGLATGSHRVPAVFVDAIDRLGGEAATGLPIADPTADPSDWPPTWLFQRFARTGQAGLASTLEIRGDPPVLYVERQGGDLAALTEAGLKVAPTSATLWQTFPCSATRGPCKVAIPNPTPLADAGKRFCGGTTYPFGPPAWKAVVGDYVATPFRGWVKSSKITDTDYAGTHETCDPASIPKVSDCRADWNLHVIPTADSRGLLAGTGRDLEIEWERLYSNYFMVLYDLPSAGDLLFTSGRWIVDCAHDDYHSEIHPPFLLAFSRTEMKLSRPETVVSVWVNGYFPGDPIELEVYPPPRPAPGSSLSLAGPFDRDAALDVRVDASFDHVQEAGHEVAGPVRLTFTADPRKVKVEDSGMMRWKTGRVYEGRWRLIWSTPP